jgi:hypothetical protein
MIVILVFQMSILSLIIYNLSLIKMLIKFNQLYYIIARVLIFIN